MAAKNRKKSPLNVDVTEISDASTTIEGQCKGKDLAPEIPELSPKQNIAYAFRIYRTAGQIIVEGKIETKLELKCARCLKDIDYPMKASFRVIFQKQTDTFSDFEELTAEDLDVRFYKDTIIELAPVISEELLLAIPMSVLCDEECQGLCSNCGQNLNEGQCQCETDEIDPRFAKLKDLFIDKNKNKSEDKGE